ncbi:MAG: hypothetical protein L3J36_13680 [Rhodobacteraceae bacterium]|nr:hypothetical protein [Paracoccaceae bacterium]
MTAQAQNWKFGLNDNKVLFRAHISTPGKPGFSLACAIRKPNPPAVVPGFFKGVTFTNPDELYLAFKGQEIGAPIRNEPRSDVLLVVGASAFRLPKISWGEYAAEWHTTLSATGPMFAAIAAAPSFEIHSNAGSVTVATSGFASGYASLVDACRRQFTASRHPWRPAPLVAPVAPINMRKTAEADVAKGCKGASTYEPGAFLSGEIDGDGVPDVVLDWRKIKCSGTFSQPFCGASMCSADVYLSGSYPRTNAPKQLLAAGVRLQPLSNGNMAVGAGGSMADCYAIGTDICEFLFYWNGADLVGLP